MNILFLIDALEVGGAETHVVTLACALHRMGHAVTVISGGGFLEAELREVGVHCFRFPACICGRTWAVTQFRNVAFLRRLLGARRFDVLHAHTRRTALLLRLLHIGYALFPPPLSLSLSGLNGRQVPYRRRVLRRLAVPATVVTAHAHFSPRFRWLSYWGEATIAVSEDLRRHVATCFGVARTRICVIPNGIDLRRFRPPADRHACSPDLLHLAFASRLDDDCSAAARAIISLAPQWERLARERGRRLRITIVGGGTQRPFLEARARGLSFVTLCGACDHMETLLCDVDVLIGVSRVALEAVSCGCAVILAGDEGFGGLLTPERFEHFAAANFCCRGEVQLSEGALDLAFCSWLDMPAARRHAITTHVRETMIARYGDERMSADTTALYRNVIRQHRQLRVVVGGYAGCGNLGDDAILRCLVHRWQGQTVPSALAGNSVDAVLEVRALIGRAGGTFGVRCYDRYRPLRALLWADAFALGGGALLQNCSRRGGFSLVYYLGLALLAQTVGCPWYVVAGGVGPLRGKMACWAVRTVLQGARGISVRDESSRRLLLRLGISPTKIVNEPDPVLSLSPVSCEEAEAALPAMPMNRAGYICVAPRGGMAGEVEMADSLARLWKEQRLYPLFFAFDTKQDGPVCQRLIDRCGAGAIVPLTGRAPERLVAGMFAMSHGVIAGRLHALILASLSGVPAWAIPSPFGDPKVTHFAESAGMRMWGTNDIMNTRECAHCCISSNLPRSGSSAKFLPMRRCKRPSASCQKMNCRVCGINKERNTS